MDVKTYFDLHSRKKICWNKEKNVLLIVRAYHIQKNNTENLPITIRTYLSNNARIKKFFAYPDLKLKLCKGKKKNSLLSAFSKATLHARKSCSKATGFGGQGFPKNIIVRSSAELRQKAELAGVRGADYSTKPKRKVLSFHHLLWYKQKSKTREGSHSSCSIFSHRMVHLWRVSWRMQLLREPQRKALAILWTWGWGVGVRQRAQSGQVPGTEWGWGKCLRGLLHP